MLLPLTEVETHEEENKLSDADLEFADKKKKKDDDSWEYKKI